jgi:hypothetical protein
MDPERNAATLQRLYNFTEDGLICEHWGLINTASLMRQLGIAGQEAAR